MTCPCAVQGAKGSPWSKTLLDDWQAGGIFSAQSGSPFTVVLSGAPVSASAAAFGNPERPDLVGDPNKLGPVAANPPARPLRRSGRRRTGSTSAPSPSPPSEPFGPGLWHRGAQRCHRPALLPISISRSPRASRSVPRANACSFAANFSIC